MKISNCKKIKKNPKILIEDIMKPINELQSPSDINEELNLNEHMEHDAPLDRNKCWLCQCPRNDKKPDIINDCDDIKRHLIADILPWLCSDCEHTMEEEDSKVSQLRNDPANTSDFYLNNPTTFPDNPECQCDTCKDYRKSEEEQKQQSIELLRLWVDLSDIVKQVYIIDRKNVDTFLQTYVSHLKGLVTRLCMHDAHHLYERLEKQGHEVIIDMKMLLLKRISPDRQTTVGGLQFVSMVIQKYQQLCLSCNVLATFLSPLVEQHLNKFEMSWQLHDRHLFHNIIYSEPVVQNYLEQAIENIKQGLSNNLMASHHREFEKALEEHAKFVKDMNLVATEWKKCEKQIETYEEKQAALKFKQKMYKEDWEFFKSQRKLLEQMVPKTKSQSNFVHHNFDMQFQQIMDGETDGYLCPNCKEYRCTYDESSISHMITCGIISPEVAEESSLLSSMNLPIYSNLQSYLNVKPPSFPSSSEDGSCESEEPYIQNRQQNISSLLDAADSLASDDEDDDFHDAQQSHTTDCCHHPTSLDLMNGSSVDFEISKTLSSQSFQASKFDHVLSRDYFSTTLTFEEDEVRSWEEANNTLMYYDKITILDSPENTLLKNAQERLIDNTHPQDNKNKNNLRICQVSSDEINQNQDACVERCDDIIHRKRIKSDSSCLRLRMSDQLSLPSDYKRIETSTNQSKPLRMPMSPTMLHEKHAPCNRRGASPHPCHQQQNRSLIDEAERVKAMGCQSKLHQDASSTTSSSSAGSCTSSCSAVHPEDCTTINSTHMNGRSSSSSRDGKQHCECWHCEFFGHEAPTSLPVSRNFTETRDRLRMKLKEKKEKGCMKASRQQQLHSKYLQQKKIISESKEITIPTTQLTTRPWSDNNDKSVVSVDDILRFINGNENKIEEVAKERKNKKSRANKNKKTKDLKELSDQQMNGMLYTLEPEQHLIAHHHPIYNQVAPPNKRTIMLVGDRGEGEVSWASEEKKINQMRLNSIVKSHILKSGLDGCLNICQVNGEAESKHNDMNDSNSVNKELKLEVNSREGGETIYIPYDSNGFSLLENAVSHLKLNPNTTTGQRELVLEDASKKEPIKELIFYGDTNVKSQKKCIENSKIKHEEEPNKSLINQQSPASSSKSKKHKKRNKIETELPFDEIFKPSEGDDIDDDDREIEEFKRFCFNTPPSLKREKLRVSLNLKDIFNKKKI